MAGIKYQIIEVTNEGTNGKRSEMIVRSIGFETRNEAEKRMSEMKPKENGKLRVVCAYY